MIEKALSKEKRLSVWQFTLPFLFSMIMPYFLLLTIKGSKCFSIPITPDFALSPELLFSIYFLIPVIIGFYGIYYLVKNKERRKTEATKFYAILGLVIINLISPILLYINLVIFVIILFKFECWGSKVMPF